MRLLVAMMVFGICARPSENSKNPARTETLQPEITWHVCATVKAIMDPVSGERDKYYLLISPSKEMLPSTCIQVEVDEQTYKSQKLGDIFVPKPGQKITLPPALIPRPQPPPPAPRPKKTTLKAGLLPEAVPIFYTHIAWKEKGSGAFFYLKSRNFPTMLSGRLDRRLFEATAYVQPLRFFYPKSPHKKTSALMRWEFFKIFYKSIHPILFKNLLLQFSGFI